VDVAIVHDYLNQHGGAERVVLELAAIWPEAPIYTSLYRPESTWPEFQRLDVHTSWLDRLPVDGGFRALAPLYPAAFRSLGTFEQDLVISSSSGWAHGVRTAPESTHVVYCHTPARWLYRSGEYLGRSARQALLAPVGGMLRHWDRAAARRADLYIANSHNVRERIRRAYGIEAQVVHPPVNVERFTPGPRGDRLLVVSRLLPYKRIELVVDAATHAGLGLDVVGVGPSVGDLSERAGPTVTFHGRLDDTAVTELMETCRAVCLPGTEDFGIAPVEANAAGKPVVAFAGGGALESVEEGVTGAFFAEPTVECLLAAVRRADAIETGPDQIARAARRFSREAFREGLGAAVQAKLERKATTRSVSRHTGR
jgi:glycosyltransferase involved in cell wall biosynthesis